MTTGTVTIEIDQATAAVLQAKASVQGMTLEAFLRHFAGTSNGTAIANEHSDLDQFLADMEAMSEGTEHIPASPITYNREDIYFDHD